MEIASLTHIKKELKYLNEEELRALIIRLAKYKKENKELINYLIYEASDEDAYISAVIEELSPEFINLNHRNYYTIRKIFRKIYRLLNKYIKYSGQKETEVRLLIFFCQEVKRINLHNTHYTVISNLYQRQLVRIEKALIKLHEDLQYDYRTEIEDLYL